MIISRFDDVFNLFGTLFRFGECQGATTANHFLVVMNCCTAHGFHQLVQMRRIFKGLAINPLVFQTGFFQGLISIRLHGAVVVQAFLGFPRGKSETLDRPNADARRATQRCLVRGNAWHVTNLPRL